MKEKDPLFIELRSEWYQKLKDSGFEDIEVIRKDIYRLKNEHGRMIRKREKKDRPVDDLIFQNTKRDYYVQLTHKVNDPETIFKSDTDRLILTLHSDGHNQVEIVKFLEVFGSPKDDHTIRFIIRRYEDEWGLKSYTRKQLNRKPKKKPATT